MSEAHEEEGPPLSSITDAPYQQDGVVDRISVDHPLVMPSGVYFGLSKERYHQALALSASGIKWLRVSPLDWWARSPLNDDPDDDDDREKENNHAALIDGEAYHTRLLEGRAVFWQRYAEALDKRDYPNAVSTNEEIRRAIEEASERRVVENGGSPIRVKAGTRKEDLIEILARYAPDTLVWETQVRAHEMAHPGKILLSAKTLRRIEKAATMIELHKDLGRAFRGGVAEVSIFWFDQETGVPMKARLDYWMPEHIIDFKTIGNYLGMTIKGACTRAINNYQYYLQAGVYLDAADEARDLIRQGLVFGRVPHAAFLNALANSSEWKWMWVFQMKGLAPVARGYPFPVEYINDLARGEIEQAKVTWAENWRTYGTDHWVDLCDIEMLDITDIPPRFGR